MNNPLEPLIEIHDKMVGKQDEKGTAEKFKEASDIFFDRLRNAPVEFMPIDWIKSLIADLQAAEKFVKEEKK